MKQHVIIAKVNDHGTATTFKKVCRSKAGALKESRELDGMNLIRRFEQHMVKTESGIEWQFVPRSEIDHSWASSSDCNVAIHVEDMEGNMVNCNIKGGCEDYDFRHFCESRDECNCDKVWPELERRGFVKA